MSELTLTYEVEESIGILTIDRPPVNALRYRDLEELTDRLRSLPRGDERVVVFETGGDKTFSAGHDVTEFENYDSDDADYRDEVYMNALTAVYESTLPIIAAVNGAAVGAGAILASVCDVRVGSPDASFAIPEIKVGIVGGYGPLRRLLPDGVARRMLYTGEPLPAKRAYELGLLSQIDEDATACAVETARSVASNSPDAIRAARAVAVESQPDWPIEEYENEREHIAELRKLPNTEEAAAAFVENRDPRFEEPRYEP